MQQRGGPRELYQEPCSEWPGGDQHFSPFVMLRLSNLSWEAQKTPGKLLRLELQLIRTTAAQEWMQWSFTSFAHYGQQLLPSSPWKHGTQLSTTYVWRAYDTLRLFSLAQGTSADRGTWHQPCACPVPYLLCPGPETNGSYGSLFPSGVPQKELLPPKRRMKTNKGANYSTGGRNLDSSHNRGFEHELQTKFLLI